MIAIPYIDVEQCIVLELQINNVYNLKQFSLQLLYDMSILEFIGGKMDESFYSTVGGWVGSYLSGELSKAFSGSATMFVYAFKVLRIGSTQISVTASLTDTSGSVIPYTVSGTSIKILSVEEWVDGEYAELKEEHNSLNESYYFLLGSYDALQEDYHVINMTYYNYMAMHSYSNSEYESLNATFHNLLAEHVQLKSDYDNLVADRDVLQANYDSLTNDYDELASKYEISTNELNIFRNLSYVFIVTTSGLILATVYFVKRKPS